VTESERLHVEAVRAVLEFLQHGGCTFCGHLVIRARRAETYEQFREMVVVPTLGEWREHLPAAAVAIATAKTKPGAAQLLEALEEV